MNSNPRCPVCDSLAWSVLGKKTFLSAEAEAKSAYDRQRLQVLFEVWCPGTQKFHLEFLACQNCGLMVYSPRPSAADLDAKYRFLGSLPEQPAGKCVPTSADQWRSRKLLHILQPLLVPKSHVLDYGGGDGRLMQDLVSAGHRCFTLDWTERAVKGVERLGATLDDLPSNARFHAIVASHVVEHIAEPRIVLSHLREHLASDGVLYVEVPLEIWRRVPHMTEPVTHVNFFVPESLQALLGYAGYSI